MSEYFIRVKEEKDSEFIKFCQVNKLSPKCIETGWLNDHQSTFLYTMPIDTELVTALKISMPIQILKKSSI